MWKSYNELVIESGCKFLQLRFSYERNKALFKGATKIIITKDYVGMPKRYRAFNEKGVNILIELIKDKYN